MPSCQACQVGVPLINSAVGQADEPIGSCVNCGSLSCGHHGHRTTSPAFLCIECDVNLQQRCGADGADFDYWFKHRPDLSRTGPGDEGGGGGGVALSHADANRPVDSARLRALGIAELARQMRSVFLAGFSRASITRGVRIASVDDWVAARPDYRLLADALIEPARDLATRLDEVLSTSTTPASYLGLAPATVPAVTPLQALWMITDEPARLLFAFSLALVQQLRLPRSRLSLGSVALADAVDLKLSQALPEKMTVWVP